MTISNNVIVQDYTLTGRHLNVRVTHKGIKAAVINTYLSTIDHMVTCI